MDRDEINKRLEQAAAGGAAARSQMTDRVVNEEAGGARALLTQEASRDRDYLRNWNHIDAQPSDLDTVALEVELTAKWNGLDAALADSVARTATFARAGLPDTIHTAREAIEAYTAASTIPGGVKAPDDPTAGMNRILNRALTNDLSYRVDEAYVRGYAQRLQTGMEWLQANGAERTALEASALAAKVDAYDVLDRINEGVASEFDYDDQVRDPDTFAQQFVSERTDAALVDAAYVAGRWSGTDPVIDSQLEALTSHTVAIEAAPQVTDQDPREVRFHFTEQTLRDGEAGLAGLTRAQTEKASVALSAAARTAARDGLDDVRNVLQAQRGSGRATTAGERRYEPPTAGPANHLER